MYSARFVPDRNYRTGRPVTKRHRTARRTGGFGSAEAVYRAVRSRSMRPAPGPPDSAPRLRRESEPHAAMCCAPRAAGVGHDVGAVAAEERRVRRRLLCRDDDACAILEHGVGGHRVRRARRQLGNRGRLGSHGALRHPAKGEPDQEATLGGAGALLGGADEVRTIAAAQRRAPRSRAGHAVRRARAPEAAPPGRRASARRSGWRA